jgi:hypothetical protein
MSKHRMIDLSRVPGFDLEYRPRNYFWAADLNVALLSSIAGESRRQVVRAMLRWDVPIPHGLDAAVLDEVVLESWGRVHPSHMGGEYLPPLRKGEVEIARISLASVTADQISIRATRGRKRIRYRVVDEYPETSTYVCHPASSVSPLSLGELIALMEAASHGKSIIFAILGINARYSTPAELAAFISVSSDFYADLGPYYHALTDAWVKSRHGRTPDEA